MMSFQNRVLVISPPGGTRGVKKFYRCEPLVPPYQVHTMAQNRFLKRVLKDMHISRVSREVTHILLENLKKF